MLMATPRALLAAIILAACAATPLATATFEARLALTLQEDTSAASQKPTPIQRVVKLLQEMKGQLEKEAGSDLQAYDKMVCWCETNDKAKTKAIEDAEAKIEELMAEVEMRAGKEGELKAKIAQAKKEIAQQKEALATATAIREKERAAFREEESESVQAVTMLKNAIQVLSKHQTGLLQLSPALHESLTSALQWVALKHEEMQHLRDERGLPPLAAGAAAPTKVKAPSLLALAEQALGTQPGVPVADEATLRSLRGGHGAVGSLVPPQFAAHIL